MNTRCRNIFPSKKNRCDDTHTPYNMPNPHCTTYTPHTLFIPFIHLTPLPFPQPTTNLLVLYTHLILSHTHPTPNVLPTLQTHPIPHTLHPPTSHINILHLYPIPTPKVHIPTHQTHLTPIQHKDHHVNPTVHTQQPFCWSTQDM